MLPNWMSTFIVVTNEIIMIILNARQIRLKKEIEDGEFPQVMNCSWSSNPDIYTLGDVEAIGWMKKEYTHDYSGEVDGWRRFYFGPNAISVDDEYYAAGEWIE